MATFRKDWLIILLLIAWLPLFGLLWPLPSKSIAADAAAAISSLGRNYDTVRHLYSETEQKEFDRGLEVLTDPDKQLSILWDRWVTLFGVGALGVCAIAYTAGRGRFWKAGLVVSSLCYLLLVTGFPITRAVRPEQWRAWWMMVSEYPSWGLGAFLYGVAVPFLHLALIVGVVVSFIFLAVKSGNLTARLRPTR